MLMALGHQHGKTLCLDDIKNSLNTDSFWTSYTVGYSPGDGHCFLHSVKSSLKSQWGIEVSIDILLRLIRHETIINRIDFIPVINGNNVYNLTKGLSDYTERKIYDSWYGDIVLTITANALDTKLIVIEKLENCFRCYSVGKNAHNATCLPLLLFKCGKHNDGLVSMHGRDYFCLGNEHVMRGSVCTADAHNADGAFHDVTKTFNSYDTSCNGQSKQNSDTDSCSYNNDLLTQCRIASAHGATCETEICDRSPEDTLGTKVNESSSSKQRVHMLSWNINWLTNDKLSDDILGNFFTKLDIILLTETWTSDNAEIELKDFTFYNCPRKYRHPNAKRDSVGIGIFVRDHIKHGVVIWRNTEDVVAWIQLKAEYFGLKRDLYVANIYMVPQGSVHVRDDIFSLLYGDLAQLPPESHVLLCGDYNAHTNVLPDYDIENFHDSEGDLMELLPHDVHKLHDDIYKLYATERLERFSRDCRPPNVQGLQLIDFCKDTGVLIMNGRLVEDKDWWLHAFGGRWRWCCWLYYWFPWNVWYDTWIWSR